MRISWWFTEIAHQIKQSEYDTNVEGDGRKEEDKKLGITVKLKVLPSDSDRTTMGIEPE